MSPDEKIKDIAKDTKKDVDLLQKKIDQLRTPKPLELILIPKGALKTTKRDNDEKIQEHKDNISAFQSEAAREIQSEALKISPEKREFIVMSAYKDMGCSAQKIHELRERHFQELGLTAEQKNVTAENIFSSKFANENHKQTNEKEEATKSKTVKSIAEGFYSRFISPGVREKTQTGPSREKNYGKNDINR